MIHLHSHLNDVPEAAELLDRVAPEGWFWTIDLDTFDMSCVYRDVLGQLFGTYKTGAEELRRRGVRVIWGWDAFSSRSTTEEWVHEIRVRRESNPLH